MAKKASIPIIPVIKTIKKPNAAVARFEKKFTNIFIQTNCSKSAAFILKA